MDRRTKDALEIWAGTVLGGVGGWWGATRLATAVNTPAGATVHALGAVLGAIAGATLTKLIVDDPGAIPRR